MAPLTDQQTADCKEAFALFDQDNDGCITTAELGTVMRALGKNPTEAEIKLLAREIDPDGRGTVNLQEFLGVMSRDIRSYDSETDIRNAWKVFDKEGRGWISAAELRHVLTSIGEKLGPDEMDAMMAESDPDGDGKIQYDEFVRMLTAK
ncbi:calmodulin [Raphidocelis subcapitata]|uniref:Calmodulin n=1 Tax=Raphidocelis subcapitata TaxID=307507 RepID=A0A2V0P7Y3_9CHLO|nr:calmodulin [Raphidocelis subcapitata]|eukprot:GBF95669.1 calmodulin [Raphidocelis subcapitata]